MTLFVRLFIVHTVPEVLSHPAQLTNAPVVAAAVKLTVVPVGKLPVQEEPLLKEQPRPDGELDMVPEPVPAESTVMVGPVPVKQTTVAVISPVTTAPEDDRPDPSLFVVSVAETKVPPHTKPVAVSRPVGSTVNICVSLEAQVTWLVISLVAGGWR